MGIIRDRFLLGLSAGFAGAVVMSGLNGLANLVPGISTKLLFGISRLFIPISLIGTWQGNIIAYIASTICGALFGLVMVWIYEITGYRHYLLKGLILGMILWLLTCGMINTGLRLAMQDSFIDNMVIILTHAAYGIAAGWVLGRYRQRIREEQY